MLKKIIIEFISKTNRKDQILHIKVLSIRPVKNFIDVRYTKFTLT